VTGIFNNGDLLSMTGVCKKTTTGASFRIDVAGTVVQKYNKMRKANVWCQIMHEPTAGNPELGWGSGKYMWPQ
jgi:hypothetical protein